MLCKKKMKRFNCSSFLELNLFLENIKDHLNLERISKLQRKFMKNKHFNDYLNLYNYMNKQLKKIFLQNICLQNMSANTYIKNNKKIILFLTDDRNVIYYFSGIFIMNISNVSKNKISFSFDSHNYTDVHNIYSNYIRGFNLYSQYILSNKFIKKLNTIIQNKDGLWKKYVSLSNNQLLMSTYSSGVLTLAASDSLSFTVYNPSIDFLLTPYTNGISTGIVISSGSASLINSSYVTENVNFLSIAGGGGPGGSASSGGGGGGFILNPVTETYPSFTDYLNGNLNIPIDVSIGTGSNHDHGGISTVFGYYICYGGGKGDSQDTVGGGGAGGGNNIDTINNGGQGAPTDTLAERDSTIISTEVPFYEVNPTTVYVSGGGAFPNLVTPFTTESVASTGEGGIGTGGDVIDGIDNIKINGSYIPNSYGGGGGSNAISVGFYSGSNWGENNQYNFGIGGNGVVMIWS